MRRPILPPGAALGAILPLFAAGLDAQVSWAPSLQEALAAARQGSQPILLVVHLTNAPGSVQLATEHLRDRDLGHLAASSQNLFLDLQVVPDEARAPRRGVKLPESITSSDRGDLWELLKVPADQFLRGPQLVFFTPEGQVIASVTGRVTKGELEWLWHHAIQKAGGKAPGELSEAARAPRDLRLGALSTWDGSSPPPTDEAVAELVAELKKSPRVRGEDLRKLGDLVRTHDPSAMDFVDNNLRSRGPFANLTLGAIALLAPRAWYSVALAALDSQREETRKAAAQALESLAHPKALGHLKQHWTKEKDESVQGALLRALAACGPTDRTVIANLHKTLVTASSEDLRVDSVIGSGLLEKRRPLEDNLARALQDTATKVRGAAVFVIGWRRDTRLSPLLGARVDSESDEELRALMRAALDAVRGGSTESLEAYFDKNLSAGRRNLDRTRGPGGGGGRPGGRGGSEGTGSNGG